MSRNNDTCLDMSSSGGELGQHVSGPVYFVTPNPRVGDL